MIGGSLSHPAKQLPRLFGSSEFLKEYPYFLPCAIPATFSLIAWFVAYFFLQEVSIIRVEFDSGTNDAFRPCHTQNLSPSTWVSVVAQLPVTTVPPPLTRHNPTAALLHSARC